jgi:hypothetical protein
MNINKRLYCDGLGGDKRLARDRSNTQNPAGRLACPDFVLCGMRLNEDALTPAGPE